MNVELATEANGDLTPESRAAVITEIFRFMATKMEPVPYATVLYHVMATFAAKEEHVSAYVMRSTHLLLERDLLSSKSFHRDSLTDETTFSIDATTEISPSRRMTNIMFREAAQ
jgi:hypothetical protein